MVAAVYVVGGETDDDRADLRYSLRSLVNAPVIDEVWVLGEVPGWFTGVKLPLEPLRDKFANQRQSITRFVNTPGVPDRFYLFNDDMYVTEPVEGLLPICRNRARMSGWLEADGRPAGVWHRAVIATAEWVGAQYGQHDPRIYECHVPLLFDTAKLRSVVNGYPADRPFAVGETYPAAGAGGEGTHCGNAKVKCEDSLTDKLAQPMPYLSGNPDTWDGPLGDYIRASFPTACRFESDVLEGVA